MKLHVLLILSGFAGTLFSSVVMAADAPLRKEHSDPPWLRQPVAPSPNTPAPLAPLPPPEPPSSAPFAERASENLDSGRLPVTAECSLLPGGDVRCQKHVAQLPFTRTETERTWYGWQTILSDSAALGMAGSAPFTKSIGTAMGSLGVYMLLPPLVHALHGHGGRAERSLVMRLAFPVGGALLAPLAVIAYGSQNSGSRLCNGSDRDCGAGLLMISGIGAAAGLVSAMVIDALSSYDERKVDRKIVRQVSWGPSVSVEPGGGRIALAGRF